MSLPDSAIVTDVWSRLRPDADLGVIASVRRIGMLLDRLDSRDVTSVVNDTGGAIVLSALPDSAMP